MSRTVLLIINCVAVNMLLRHLGVLESETVRQKERKDLRRKKKREAVRLLISWQRFAQAWTLFVLVMGSL